MKKYIQYQKPMAVVLTALILPCLMAINNFGWRALAVVALCNACTFIGEYLFVRKQGKPVTMAAFVTGTLLALVMPPNIPFWMAAFGSFFAIIFGKMVFGGFGKNIFNPAMVGRCFLYIAFPSAMASTWFSPIQGEAGGFTRWQAQKETEPVVEVTVDPEAKIDGVTGATTLAAVKKINQASVKANKVLAQTGEDTPEVANEKRQAEKTLSGAEKAISELDYTRMFIGREAGSMGETSVLAILVGLAYMLYKKAAKWQLVVGPAIGMIACTALLKYFGIIAIPLG
ncbi:MAG: RnfABCDGE type electron transport complex subunit D, partial [Planctomycetes bacterium]|nr:RnfABCDGE type electron transport complex subunit D [Planctomycetota bacterium]